MESSTREKLSKIGVNEYIMEGIEKRHGEIVDAFNKIRSKENALASKPFALAFHALIMDSLGLEIVPGSGCSVGGVPFSCAASRVTDPLDLVSKVRGLRDLLLLSAKRCNATRIHVLTPVTVEFVSGGEVEVYIDSAFEDANGVFYAFIPDGSMVSSSDQK